MGHASESPPSMRGGGGAVEDCLSCRVVGTVTCLGLSGYLALSTYARPPVSPLQRFITLAVAGGFAALGVTRAAL